MDLSRQNELLESFRNWFDASGSFGDTSEGRSLRWTIEDNRRRYRMILSEKDIQRRQRDLSALPSTKSRSIVDGIADAFVAEYAQDADSISYTSKSPQNPQADQLAAWLTGIFTYRAEYTFPFYAWNEASIKAGLVDGIECAFVYWKNHTYNDKATEYYFVDGINPPQPVAKDIFDAFSGQDDRFVSQKVDVPVTVCDSFWIDTLIPGDSVFWDPKAPYLNVNLGTFACVVRDFSIAEIESFMKAGLFTKIKPKDLEEWQTVHDNWYRDRRTLTADPEQIDLGDLNSIRVHIFFFKDGFRWKCQFSIEGKQELSAELDVNETFFAGRKVNRLPLVIGFNRSNLHENFGAGIPMIIASHEDEWSDTRNNIQDAARQSLLQRWRIQRGSNVNLDDLLNKPAVFADPGEIERLNSDVNMMPAMRTSDQMSSDISELVPTAISNRGRSVAPKGTNQTLGAAQLMEQDSGLKRNNQLRLRNETFLKPILYLIAELIFAYESDDTVARVAASKSGIPLPEIAGKVDFSQLDFPVDVVVNAGSGAIPRYQKAQTIMQIAGWRKENGIPTDALAIAKQLNVLAGFTADAFLPSQPPQEPPPKVDYKATINIDLTTLMAAAPEAGQFLLEKMMTGGMSVEAKVKDNTAEMMQNGGGMVTPDRTGQIIDSTGESGLAMAQGGENSQIVQGMA